MRILISGGVKSGKSHRALQIARTEFIGPVTFIATAEILDQEMRGRIERHRIERLLPDGRPEFITIEEPLDLPGALRRGGPRTVVDCIPMWVNNLMYHKRTEEFTPLLETLLQVMPLDCVVVTNETGLGNIPFDEETRHFNLLLAEANRAIAALAERVEFMVSGIPLRVK